MPSAFIEEQAELLHRTKDTFGVLQRIRDKYALSSFPSQMTRVKEVWYSYGDRHENFEKMYKKGLKSLVSQGVSSRFIQQYKDFHSDGIKEQLRKRKLAAAEKYTGSRRTDRAIASIPILPEYMHDYKLTKDDIVKNNARSEQCLETRAMSCVMVENTDKLVSKCCDIVKKLDEDVFIIAAAIAVLCGRRSIEILKTGSLQDCKRRGCYSALFDGAAKKRGVQSKAIEIPLLIKFKYLKPAVDHVRSEINVRGLTNSKINAKYSHKLGDAAKLLMEKLDARFHDLRAVYGCVTHQVFRNTCSINIWLKKVLMHDNIDTSVFYSRCKISKCTLNLGKWEVE